MGYLEAFGTFEPPVGTVDTGSELSEEVRTLDHKRMPRSEPLTGEDGVTIRTCRVSDRAALVRFLTELSPESRYRRFFSTLVDLEEQAHLLTSQRTLGVVAVKRDRRVVGHAHLSDLDSVPELAIAVADTYQGRGLGRGLLHELGRSAAAKGIDAYHARFLATNQPMLKLLRSLGCALTDAEDTPVVDLLVGTSSPMPRWPSPAGRRPRVLVEARGLFGAEESDAVRELGCDTLRCPGPFPGWTCPLVSTSACPLADSADLIVFGFPLDDNSGKILGAHRRCHGSIPVLFETRSEADTDRAQALAASSAVPHVSRDREGFAARVAGLLGLPIGQSDPR